jgi:hypothetical protein
MTIRKIMRLLIVIPGVEQGEELRIERENANGIRIVGICRDGWISTAVVPQIQLFKTIELETGKSIIFDSGDLRWVTKTWWNNKECLEFEFAPNNWTRHGSVFVRFKEFECAIKNFEKKEA